MSTASIWALALTARRRPRPGSKSKGFGEAQVHDKVPRAVAVVNRQKFSAAEYIEGSQGRAVNVVLRPGGQRMGGTRGSGNKPRTIVVNLVSIYVNWRCYVKRRTGTDHHEWTQTK